MGPEQPVILFPITSGADNDDDDHDDDRDDGENDHDDDDDDDHDDGENDPGIFDRCDDTCSRTGCLRRRLLHTVSV